MISVGLGEALIATDTIIGILDNNATTGEGGIVGHILRWTVFTTRFLAGRVAFLVQFIDALITTIAHATYAVWQFVEHLGRLQEVDVSLGTGHAVRNIDDFAGFFMDRYLALNGVRFLFAAIPVVQSGLADAALFVQNYR